MRKRIKLYIYVTAIMGTMMGYAQQNVDYSPCFGLELNSTQYNDCKRSIDAHYFQMEEAKRLEAIAVAAELQSMGVTLLTTQTQIQSIDLSALQAQIQASVAKSQAAQYALDQARQAKIQAEQALAQAQQQLDMAREIAATGQSPQLSPTQIAQTAATEYTAQTIYYAQLAAQQYAYATQTTTSGSSTIPTWYMDNDGDGWHIASQQRSTCPGQGWCKTTTYGIDCNDNDATKTYNCSITTQPSMMGWFLDKDGDGYHAEAKGATSSPGSGWTSTMTKGPDCDDNNATIPLILSCFFASVPPPDGNKDCQKRTGYLHDANFTNKTPTLGNNTTIMEDNFRNDSWGIISETNCGSGRIPKGSTVNVLSTAAVTRTGTTLKYYKVEYDECMESNKERLNCGGDPCKVTANFGTNAKIESVNKCSLEKIKEIANRLSINKFKITSTSRTAEDQARIMYDNIVTYGVTKQKSLYGSNGDNVIDAYTAALNANKTKEQIKQAMLDKINEIGANNISNHAADSNTLTVVDIAPSSMSSSQRTKFVEAINRAIANGDVSRFFHPGNSNDPAYHIEIKVKNCELKNCI